MSALFPYRHDTTLPGQDAEHRESMEVVNYHLEGKTIAKVFTGGSFEGLHLTSMRIEFTDGTQIEVRPNEAGAQLDVTRSGYGWSDR